MAEASSMAAVQVSLLAVCKSKRDAHAENQIHSICPVALCFYLMMKMSNNSFLKSSPSRNLPPCERNDYYKFN